MKWLVKASRLEGRATVPGDKSIAHRALMIAALARGRSVIENLPDAGDVNSTANCLRSLGIRIETNDRLTEVRGSSMTGSAVLDAGNSGTTMRLLSGLLAGRPVEVTITGDASLLRRPMARVVDPLRLMGACIESDEGYAPLRLKGTRLRGITYQTPVPSAQVKSCVLFAALSAEGRTSVAESILTRDHSERLLRHAGVEFETDASCIRVTGPQAPHAFELNVPGDMSSAAFLFAGAAVTGSSISVSDVGTNPTRTGFLAVLEKMGADVSIENEVIEGNEPRATVTVAAKDLHGVEVSQEDVPGCIDELPLVALVATTAKGTTTVRGAAELRVKESDRIGAVVRGLGALGADVTALRDGFVVRGPCRLRGTSCSSHGDHRIAMMLALAGLIAAGETIIERAESAHISYPGFAPTLIGLGASIHED